MNSTILKIVNCFGKRIAVRADIIAKSAGERMMKQAGKYFEESLSEARCRGLASLDTVLARESAGCHEFNKLTGHYSWGEGGSLSYHLGKAIYKTENKPVNRFLRYIAKKFGLKNELRTIICEDGTRMSTYSGTSRWETPIAKIKFPNGTEVHCNRANTVAEVINPEEGKTVILHEISQKRSQNCLYGSQAEILPDGSRQEFLHYRGRGDWFERIT